MDFRRRRPTISGLDMEGTMPDFATTDLLYAIVHHVLVFALAGVIAYEFAVVCPSMTAADILRVGKVDMWYGLLAGLILIVGFARAVYAAKGWAYYSHNHFFWAKIGTFALVGILSLWPTIQFIRWRGELKNDQSAMPSAGAIAAARRFIWLEAILFALIPVFAAAMARGYGEVS
jgi:putative membrane protein